VIAATPEGIVLGLHVVAGFLALFAGAGALATRKGGRRHRRLGRVYVYSMTFVAGSALLLYAFDRTFTRLFLGLVAVFSYYFVFSGYRVLGRKRPADDPATADWVAVGLLTLAGLGLVAMGVRLVLDGEGFAAVLLVFGTIATGFAANDVRSFADPDPEPRAWLYGHLARMIGAYMATVTAFSTVNFAFLPVVVRWLWPTAVGVPAILLLLRNYRRGPATTA
jgi:uncharacterized membrane protein